ncbi:MAG: magnesium transporter, partial [Gammaproteobacteria bacterium]
MTAETNESTNPWVKLLELAERGDADALTRYAEEIGPSETFRSLLHLPSEARATILTTMLPASAADLLEEFPDEHSADLLEDLEPAEAALIVAELRPDDQVDVLSEFSSTDAEAIIANLPSEDARDVRALIDFDDDVAGGLMTTDFLAYGEDTQVSEVIDDLNRRAAEGVDAQETYVYVISRWGKLVGVLDFRELAIASNDTMLAGVSHLPQYVLPHTPLEELDDFFDRHEFFTVPVVDQRQQLIGIVRRNAMREALVERAELDLLKTQGIVGGDELRSQPTMQRAKRRLSWLSVNIILNIAAASVIAAYEDTLSAAIALAVFLPIVSDMSGCSGNQAVAVSMRELSLGVVRPTEVLRVWLQEVKVGIMNGLVLGTLLGIAAYAWKGNAFLGIVVGTALAVNT